MRDAIKGDLPGHRSREHRGVDPEGAEDIHRIGALWLTRSGARRISRLPAGCSPMCGSTGCSPNTAARRDFIFPAMGDDGLSVGSGCPLHARDGIDTWLLQAPAARQCLSRQNYDDRIDARSARRRCGGYTPATGRDRGRPHMRRQGGRDLYRPHGIRSARARRAVDHREPHDATINDNLNKRLDRSEFMPFAPYVLEEDAERVFEITP